MSRIKQRIIKIIGEDDVIYNTFEKLYGKGDYLEEINEIKLRNRKKIIIVSLIILTMICIIFFNNDENQYIGKSDGRRILELCKAENTDGYTAVDVKITAKRNSATLTKKVKIKLDNNKKSKTENMEKDYNTELENKIDAIVREINSNESKIIKLPTKLEDGTEIIWEKERKNDIPFVLLLGTGMIYFTSKERYSEISKLEVKAKKSIIRELPNFINNIILYLNAGIVFSEAVERITNDYIYNNKLHNNYFYNQLVVIVDNSKNVNTSIEKEIEDFAQRSKVQEAIRVSKIINENIFRGTGLVEKLKQESENLWYKRKKQAEEQGRIAETKMTVPLIILLIVLLVITVSPAMLEI